MCWQTIKEKLKYWLKVIAEFIFNPRLLLCFGIAWIITNGWAYVAIIVGTWLKIEWLVTIAGAYTAILWIPATPEKIITILIAIFLLKLLFPNDKKTLEKLYIMKEKIKSSVQRRRLNKKNKKHKNTEENNKE